MNKLLIYGLGDFAKLMRYYFERDTDLSVAAFCADRDYINKNTFDGLPVFAIEDINKRFSVNEYSIFVAVGYSNMRARVTMYEKALLKSYKLVNYVSPKAYVDKTVVIGFNNVVLHGTQIEPYCIIGDNNIIWASVNISHDVKIDSHCFVASQSLLGGKAKINDGCFLGFNSTIIQEVTLAKETLVGAKSLVIKPTEPYSKNIGIPSRLVEFHLQEGIVIK